MNTLEIMDVLDELEIKVNDTEAFIDALVLKLQIIRDEEDN